MDDPVHAPMGLVEENRATQPVPTKEVLVVGSVKGVKFDAEVGKQRLGGPGIGGRRLQCLGAAVTDQSAPLSLELIAFRVAAEVVVIVQQEQAGLRVRLQVEVRGRQAAEPCANDDQVVVAVVLLDNGAPVPSALPSQFVGHLESAHMAATQAGQGRWVAGQ